VSDEKLNAAIALAAGILNALDAAKKLAEYDDRSMRFVTSLQGLKKFLIPLLQEESSKLLKEDEEFDDFSTSKTNWIEGRR
jgi:hypothetical protein